MDPAMEALIQKLDDLGFLNECLRRHGTPENMTRIKIALWTGSWAEEEFRSSNDIVQTVLPFVLEQQRKKLHGCMSEKVLNSLFPKIMDVQEEELRNAINENVNLTSEMKKSGLRVQRQLPVRSPGPTHVPAVESNTDIAMRKGDTFKKAASTALVDYNSKNLGQDESQEPKTPDSLNVAKVSSQKNEMSWKNKEAKKDDVKTNWVSTDVVKTAKKVKREEMQGLKLQNDPKVADRIQENTQKQNAVKKATPAKVKGQTYVPVNKTGHRRKLEGLELNNKSLQYKKDCGTKNKSSSSKHMQQAFKDKTTKLSACSSDSDFEITDPIDDQAKKAASKKVAKKSEPVPGCSKQATKDTKENNKKYGSICLESDSDETELDLDSDSDEKEAGVASASTQKKPDVLASSLKGNSQESKGIFIPIEMNRVAHKRRKTEEENDADYAPSPGKKIRKEGNDTGVHRNGTRPVQYESMMDRNKDGNWVCKITYCGFKSKDQHEVDRHIKSVHLKNRDNDGKDDDDDDDDDDKGSQCIKEKKRLKKADKKEKRNDNKENQTKKDAFGEKASGYKKRDLCKCDICGQAKRGKDGLRDHMAKMHPAPDAPKYHCPYAGCKRFFRVKRDLNRHVKVHEQKEEQQGRKSEEVENDNQERQEEKEISQEEV